MFVIRPVTTHDIETYVQFAFSASLGILSMPKNRELLQKNIDKSIESFGLEIMGPQNEFYLFALENSETNQVGGICGIASKIGVETPDYFFRLETSHPKPHGNLPLRESIRILKTVKETSGPSEICSLYITPEFRKEGLGRLLSLCRFLFIACFPQRFEEEIVALMRGYVDKNNSNPLWDHLGKYFLNIQYLELLQLQEGGRGFVSSMLPKYPIYLDLLPKEAAEALGKVHNNTKPALNMLMQEGFEMAQEYDIFDGGPKLIAHRNDIRAYKECKIAVVEDILSQDIDSDQFIVSNTSMNFRACYSPLKFLTEDKVLLPADIGEELMVNTGDLIRYVAPNPARKQ
jgi:arginine N-succinyltransferase